MTGKTMVIGLDGVPHWILRKFAADGTMPHVASLFEQGTLRPLQAPLPDISSTSWATFLTGANPGQHGIYGFNDFQPGSYENYFPNLSDFAVPPLWEPIQKNGLVSLLINVPSTYPAPTISGAVISGFVAPDFQRAVTPRYLLPLLKSLNYELDVEVGDVQSNPIAFIDHATRCLSRRCIAFDQLLDYIDWDLAICVITETDRIHHFLWSSVVDPTARMYPMLVDFYRTVDKAIAGLDKKAGPDTSLLLVSDHGFGPVHTQVCINSYLRQQGILALPHDAAALSEIGPDTVAFALDPARIYLNDIERFPNGRRFTEAEREFTLARLIERLTELRVWCRDEERTVISRTWRARELYSGSRLRKAPDLVAVPTPGFQLRGTWAEPNLTMESPLTGTHTPDDALFWQRGEFSDGAVDMIDVAPTVLASLGLPRAVSMEGRVLTTSPTVEKSSYQCNPRSKP